MTQRVSVIYDRLMVFCLCAAIYFLPISNALLEIFSVSAILLLLLKRWHLFFYSSAPLRQGGGAGWGPAGKAFALAFCPQKNPLNIPLVLFTAANFLSVIFSQDVGLSFKGLLFKFLEGIFLFFVFLEVLQTHRRLAGWLAVFSISFSLLSVDGIFQHLTGKDFIHGYVLDEVIRSTGSFKHPNDYGTYLAFGLMVAAGILVCRSSLIDLYRYPHPWQGRRSVKCLYWGALVILAGFSVFSLIYSYSRGAWLAVSLGLLVLCFLLREWRVFIFTFLIFVVFVMFYGQLLDGRPHVKFHPAQYSSQQLSAHSWNENLSASAERIFGSQMGRIGFWREAVAVIKRYPVFGSGLNTYNKMMKNDFHCSGVYAHNCYLQMAAETGMVGLAAFLWLIFSFYRSALKRVSRSAASPWRAIICGFLAGIFAFLIHGFFDTNFYSVRLSLLPWMGMGYVLAVLNLLERTDPRNSRTG